MKKKKLFNDFVIEWAKSKVCQLLKSGTGYKNYIHIYMYECVYIYLGYETNDSFL